MRIPAHKAAKVVELAQELSEMLDMYRDSYWANHENGQIACELCLEELDDIAMHFDSLLCPVEN